VLKLPVASVSQTLGALCVSGELGRGWFTARSAPQPSSATAPRHPKTTSESGSQSRRERGRFAGPKTFGDSKRRTQRDRRLRVVGAASQWGSGGREAGTSRLGRRQTHPYRASLRVQVAEMDVAA
jgi:hypothetical protein